MRNLRSQFTNVVEAFQIAVIVFYPLKITLAKTSSITDSVIQNLKTLNNNQLQLWMSFENEVGVTKILFIISFLLTIFTIVKFWKIFQILNLVRIILLTDYIF